MPTGSLNVLTENMSGNWYCLIFGEELGPMSWDDLVSMAAHGTLGKRERVRQGADAEWLAAELVPGLFSSNTAGQATQSANDLDFETAEPAPRTTDDDTEFEMTPSATREAPVQIEESPADTDFDFAAAPTNPDGDAEFDDAGGPPPSRAALAPAASSDEKLEISPPAAPIAKNDAETRLHREEPNLETGKQRAKAAPTKKSKEKSSGLSAETTRALKLVFGAVGAIGSAYLVYLGIVALAATRKPNYDEILAGYEQLYQQAQSAQGDSAVLANPQATTQFLTTLKILRARLKNTDPDSADGQLAEAGTLLAQLFATAGASPGTETAQERKQAETDYLAKISAVRTKLGE